MKLADYFEGVKGLGVLGTADSEGKVDLAVYARPHVIDETTIALIMSDRLSHANLQSNPSAAYLFMEQGEGYVGRRLYLTKIREETDPERIDAIRREGARRYPSDSKKYLVYFRVEKVRPLVGGKV
ncbi:MAG: pyridoxamine 5'-phosphate oxidase family protein [Phycisphaerales bacterium]|nr:MAG: pyridoxamine 5'-phosphate oxidase family protein [Phycisphaerales bacterium]